MELFYKECGRHCLHSVMLRLTCFCILVLLTFHGMCSERRILVPIRRVFLCSPAVNNWKHRNEKRLCSIKHMLWNYVINDRSSHKQVSVQYQFFDILIEETQRSKIDPLLTLGVHKSFERKREAMLERDAEYNRY